MATENLLPRLLTALLLIPLVVGGVLFLPTLYLALILGVITLLGGWEWTHLIGLTSLSGRLLFLCLQTASLGGVYVVTGDASLSFPFFLVIVIWWLLVGVKLLQLRTIEPLAQSRFLQRGVVGLLLLIPPWAALVVLHQSGESGPTLVLFLLALIWMADSSAYFSGYRWGRSKMAPLISPGKTRAGLYGALVSAVVCGVLLAWLISDLARLPWFILLTVVTVLFSVMGDLYESFCKRRAGVKDSGDILPGHGGVLDRVDSLTAAAPVFLVGLMLLGAV